jgi:hypothetical protein
VLPLFLALILKMRLPTNVAKSWQNFPASPAEKFLLSKKVKPPSKFDFLKAFGLMKILLFVSTCLRKVSYFFDLHRIRENKRRKTNF